jgi:hypothetical protein
MVYDTPAVEVPCDTSRHQSPTPAIARKYEACASSALDPMGAARLL